MKHMDCDAAVVFVDDDLPDCDSQREPALVWKIMIVDDDESVHEVTELSLAGFQFDGRMLEFVHCHSGDEARRAMVEHPDTAVMLLDVVMENQHAGLDVTRFVRNELGNTAVRIVLRTGQPGLAPEREVITGYDINDYREKSELTSGKLFTLMHSALRSYRDIRTIEASKRGLLHVIEASKDVFRLSTAEHFAEAVLGQMATLLRISPGALYMNTGGLAARFEGEDLRIIAGTGIYGERKGEDARAFLSHEKLELLASVVRDKGNRLSEHQFVAYFEDSSGGKSLLLIDGIERVGVLERRLVELFAKNVAVAFENVHLHEDLEATQREIAYRLGEAVETRSRETGNHVKRVAEISQVLARAAGLDDDEAEVLRLASPLHDVGKIAIPDTILNKPGPLTDDERETMKRHALIGRDMLAGSNRRVLQAAAIVAGEHHERWDGGGYPFGKSGEDIHIYGRITAVADVFDALASDRCYKRAWPMPKVIDYMTQQSGRQFDPRLVEVFLGNLDAILRIHGELSDQAAA